jgi:hypothetical protein
MASISQLAVPLAGWRIAERLEPGGRGMPLVVYFRNHFCALAQAVVPPAEHSTHIRMPVPLARSARPDCFKVLLELDG